MSYTVHRFTKSQTRLSDSHTYVFIPSSICLESPPSHLLCCPGLCLCVAGQAFYSFGKCKAETRRCMVGMGCWRQTPGMWARAWQASVTPPFTLGIKSKLLRASPEGDPVFHFKPHFFLCPSAPSNIFYSSLIELLLHPQMDLDISSLHAFEIKRCFLLGRKAMKNLDRIIKSRDITYFTLCDRL